MRGLNPLTGHLYLEALDITRAAREVASLTLGKYSHPSTIFPIVRAIVDLGHNLGLAVVAEGVEDETSMAQLAALGCDIVQGYFVRRPLPPADMLARMEDSSWRVRPLGGVRVA